MINLCRNVQANEKGCLRYAVWEEKEANEDPDIVLIEEFVELFSATIGHANGTLDGVPRSSLRSTTRPHTSKKHTEFSRQKIYW